jgi:replicative superfamily II helicase
MDQKYLESVEMWCWRKMEISWTDRVRNKEVLRRVKEERNILHTIKRRKANWIGHILRRNCLLKHVIEGKLEGRIEMMGRRGRRRNQLLDDLTEIERGRIRSHPVENSLWKRLRTCRKTDYRMNE